MKKVLIINGPNLNLLGTREPNIYGTIAFNTFLAKLIDEYKDIQIEYYQSNHEGDIIDKLQEVGFSEDYIGIVLNAGAYTHTSVAIHDAIKSIKKSVVEVHISNINTREEYRKTSMIADACVGSIIGLGLYGYKLAIDYLYANN